MAQTTTNETANRVPKHLLKGKILQFVLHIMPIIPESGPTLL